MDTMLIEFERRLRLKEIDNRVKTDLLSKRIKAEIAAADKLKKRFGFVSY